MNKGFSLVETLISTALLALLSVGLVYSSISLREYTGHSLAIIEQSWKKRSLAASGKIAKMALSDPDSAVSISRWQFVDTNNDGIEDGWRELEHSKEAIHSDKSIWTIAINEEDSLTFISSDPR